MHLSDRKVSPDCPLGAQDPWRLRWRCRPTDDKNSLVDIMIRLNQAVHDLGQILPFDTEFARAAAFAERQNDGVRSILGFGSRDSEEVVFALLDVLNLFTLAQLEIRALQDFVPEGDQLFLAQFCLLEFSVHREFYWARQDQFLPRIFGDGTADFSFVHREVVEFFL